MYLVADINTLFFDYGSTKSDSIYSHQVVLFQHLHHYSTKNLIYNFNKDQSSKFESLCQGQFAKCTLGLSQQIFPMDANARVLLLHHRYRYHASFLIIFHLKLELVVASVNFRLAIWV